MPQLVWLVTGAATGFGEALVYEALKRGDKAIATARNATQRLKSQEEAGAAIIDLDVTASQADLEITIGEALKIYGKIDVLANFAAYIEAGFLEELGDERTKKVFETNFFSALDVTRALLPHFRERRSGTILFMSSIATYEAKPTSGAYAATKAGTEAVALCLSQELEAFGIKICTLVPGEFRTAIFSPEKIVYGSQPINDYATANKLYGDYVANHNGHQLGDPNAGARRIVDAVRSEAMADGKQLPAYLPLGQDALDAIREHCKMMLETCDEWEAVAQSTAAETRGA